MRFLRMAVPILLFWVCGTAGAQGRRDLVLRERLRIGDGPSWALSEISSADVDADGNIYVGQPQEQHVKVFAADGSLLRTIGRRGKGPGEFSSVTAVRVLRDTLWVSDARLQRVTYFSLDGRVIRTSRWPYLSGNTPRTGSLRGFAALVPIGPTRDGGTIAVALVGGEDSDETDCFTYGPFCEPDPYLTTDLSLFGGMLERAGSIQAGTASHYAANGPFELTCGDRVIARAYSPGEVARITVATASLEL